MSEHDEENAENVNVLLVTANVGTLFEDVCKQIEKFCWYHNYTQINLLHICTKHQISF